MDRSRFHRRLRGSYFEKAVIEIVKKTFLAIFAVAALSVGSVNQGQAQTPTTHTIQAVMVTPPNGVNSTCVVHLHISPNDTDLMGFDIRVGFDDSKADLTEVRDISGQPSAGIEYILGVKNPMSEVPYVTHYRYVGCSTLADIMFPIAALAELRFTVKSSDPNLYVYLRSNNVNFPNRGLVDGNGQLIPTAYQGLAPVGSSVGDWAIY